MSLYTACAGFHHALPQGMRRMPFSRTRVCLHYAFLECMRWAPLCHFTEHAEGLTMPAIILSFAEQQIFDNICLSFVRSFEN